MRKWRLDTLLRLRSLAERQSRIQLARSTRAEMEAGDEVSRRQESQRGRELPHGELSGAQLRALHLQGVRSVELIAAAEEAYREAQETAALDRLGWTRAAAEEDAVERLAEGRRREAAEMAQRAAADHLDDLVGLLRAMRAER